MIVVLKPDISEETIAELNLRITELGFSPRLIRGEQRTIFAVVGDDNKPEADSFQLLPGVEQVLRVLKPFKLASRETRHEDTVIELPHGVKLGGGYLGMIAGPCAVETYERLDRIAGLVKAAGANILRGGAFKPRTSPYSFQGMGEDGLKILRDVGEKYAMPVLTEVMDPRRVELIARYTDMFQIGARNMQNFDLLREVGRAEKPVLLKRGMAATVQDLLMSAEYVLAEGNHGVVLCERGVRSFEDSTRNMLDMAAVPNVQSQSHLPIVVDPSHATGRPDLIPAMARASLAAGADGVHIEVHDEPAKATSDGAQALLPETYRSLMTDLRRLAAIMGKTISEPR